MGTAGVIVGVLGTLAYLVFKPLLRRRDVRRIARALHKRHRAHFLESSGWRVVEGEDPEPWREPVASEIAAERERLGFARSGYMASDDGRTPQDEQHLLTIFINSSGDVHAASR